MTAAFLFAAAGTWPVAARGGWDEPAARSPADFAEVQFGYDGLVRIGHWVPFRLAAPPGLPKGARLELRTIDSDASPVAYVGAAATDAQGRVHARLNVGRMSGDLTARWLDDAGRVLGERRWPRLRDSSFRLIPSTNRLLVAVGGPWDYRPILPAAPSEESAWRVAELSDPADLGSTAADYDGVDLVVVLAETCPAERFSGAAVAALAEWVEMGGRLVLSVGENAGQWIGEGKPLERFAPGRFRAVEAVTASDALEFYARPTRQQLLYAAGQQLAVCGFESVEGKVEVQQGEFPLIVRRAMGLGEVVFVGFDVLERQVAQWGGQPRLMAQVLGWTAEGGGQGSESGSAASVHYGFRDISGQARAALERFRRVPLITFTWVALLIVAYLLAIGPGDYFFLRRVVGRMEWTWVSFTAVTLLFGGLAGWLVARAKPSALQVNQAEVIDFDLSSRAVRGSVWANLFSPRSATLDVGLAPPTRSEIEIGNYYLSAFGLPGRGIGGMQSTTEWRRFSQAYRVQSEAAGGGEAGTAVRMQMAEVPIGVASTKPLFGRWHGEHTLQAGGPVTYSPRANQLSGALRNPLEVDLNDCFFLYGTSAYLYGRVRAGQSVEIGAGTERSLQGFLQADPRGRGDSQRWAVADRSLPRILLMQMFFHAAGGSSFTGLTHDYQSDLDLSRQLELGRGIFVGRIDGGLLAPLTIGGVGAAEPDQQLTFVRFVVPVEVQQRRGASRSGEERRDQD